MFKVIKQILNLKKQLQKMKLEIEYLKFDIQQCLSISEKYFPIMKNNDKIQLLILRRNLWIKN